MIHVWIEFRVNGDFCLVGEFIGKDFSLRTRRKRRSQRRDCYLRAMREVFNKITDKNI